MIFFLHTPATGEHKASQDKDKKTTVIDLGREEEERQWTEVPQPSYLGLGQKLPATGKNAYQICTDHTYLSPHTY